MNNVILSIIIPIFNTEHFLSDCLNSICTQIENGKEVEVVCVNDGSTDASFEVAKKIALENGNINWNLIDSPNLGVSNARNLGIKNARGKYIWFVDSDDLILNKSIDYILSILNSSNYDRIRFGAIAVTEECKYNTLPLMKRSFIVKNSGICTNVVRRDIIIDNNLFFNTEISYGEDLLWLDYLGALDLKCKKLPLLIYCIRARKSSAMASLANSSLAKKKYIEGFYVRLGIYDNEVKQAKTEFLKKYFLEKKSAMIRNLLFNCFLVSPANAKNLLSELKSEGNYPYPLRWIDLFSFYNIKDYLVKSFCFLFSFEKFFLFVCFLNRIKK